MEFELRDGPWAASSAGRPWTDQCVAAHCPLISFSNDHSDRTVMGSDARTLHAQQMLRDVRAVANGHAGRPECEERIEAGWAHGCQDLFVAIACERTRKGKIRPILSWE